MWFLLVVVVVVVVIWRAERLLRQQRLHLKLRG